MNSSAHTLCLKCNEFWGNPQTKGLCSVCFRSMPKEETSLIDNKEVMEVSPNIEISAPAVEETKPEEIIESKPERPVQLNKNACWTCSKMVGYLGFKCNCGYIFCSTHRHFRDHNCDFDFKSHDRAKLQSKIEMMHGKPLK